MKNTFFFLFILVLTSCSSSTIEIDNPTSEAITVTIGDLKPIEVKAYGNKEISLDADGKEILVNGKSLGTLTMRSSENYLLNPTQSVYYIEENEYGVESNVDPLLQSQLDKMMKDSQADMPVNPDEITSTILLFDDVIYMGKARADSSLLIKNFWDYGVHDDLPSYIKTTKARESKKKIYREEFFIKHAAKIYREAIKSLEKEG